MIIYVFNEQTQPMNKRVRKGAVTLTGVVKTLRIGGQGFCIDNVCVKK